MSVKELAEAKKALGVKTDKELAELLGIKTESVNNYRHQGIPKDVQLLIKEKSYIANNTHKVSMIKEKDTVQLKYYPDIYAFAGYGASNDNMEYELVTLSQAMLPLKKIKNFKNLEIIRVIGDSMYPYAEDGELVIVERGCKPLNNDIIIANINGDVYIKQYEKQPFSNEIRLVSKNETYPPIIVKGAELEQLQIVGVVRATIKLF